MEIITVYTTYFVVTLALVYIAHIIGSIFKSLIGFEFNNENSTKSFNIIIGLIVIVSIYAIYKTAFQTVFLVAIFTFLTYLKIKKPEIKHYNLTLKLKDIGVLFIIFIILSVNKLPYSGLIYPGYFGDYLFYGDVAQSLNLYSVENYFQHANLIIEHQQTPYHYFDLWLTALVGQASNLPYVTLYVSCIATTFSFSLFLAFQAFFKSAPKIGLLAFIALLTIGFGSIIPSTFIKEYIPIIEYYTKFSSFGFKFKTFPLIALGLIFLKNIQNKTIYKQSFFFATIILAISIENIVFSSIIILLITFLYYKVHNSIPYKELIIFAISIIYILSFYFIFNQVFNTSSGIINRQINFSIIRVIKQTTGTILSIIIFYIIPISIAFLYIKNKKADYLPLLLYFFLSFLVILIIAFTIGIFQKDGLQFFTSTIWAISIIILYLAMVKQIGITFQDKIKNKIIFSIVTFFLLSFLIIKKYRISVQQNHFYSRNFIDQDYLQKIKSKAFQINKSKYIAVFEDEKVKGNRRFYSFNPIGFYLPIIINNAKLIRLSDYHAYISHTDAYEKSILEKGLIVNKIKKEYAGKQLNREEAIHEVHNIIEELGINTFILTSSTLIDNYQLKQFFKERSLEISFETKNKKFGELFLIVEKIKTDSTTVVGNAF